MASAFDRLVTRLHRLEALGEAMGHLHWDQETYMPPGGIDARAFTRSQLSTLAHELFTSEGFGRALAEAERELKGEPEDADGPAMVREVRKGYERQTRVPGELVARISKATSRAMPVWAEARRVQDYARFEPALSEIVELKRAYADAVDPDAGRYEALFGDYEPWLALDDALATVSELRDGLVPLVARAPPEDDQEVAAFSGRWPADAQRALCERLLDALGYDRAHGRLDESNHPFSMGNPYDARVTTRVQEEEPLGALLSTAHEFGHALYTLGLPKEHFGTPLGDARDLVVHESQSRLWENHVARSRPFWDHFVDNVQDLFPQQAAGLTAERAWRGVNVVRPSLVRVESDELTYHLHIALRTELEQRLLEGALSTPELADTWNDRTEDLLGIRPPHDALGCLQDIHWSQGAFGYFPTYTLGSMLAAQVFAAYQADARAEGTDPAQAFREGAFGPLTDWLREHVHRHGCRYTTPELVERATGAPLGAEAFLAYAEDKYSGLWS